MTNLPPTPELDKRHALIETGAPAAVGDFLDWLATQGIVLAIWDRDRIEPRLVPWSGRYEQLLADHFGLDLDKIDAEQRAILKVIGDAP